jgi:hypothetical protein
MAQRPAERRKKSCFQAKTLNIGEERPPQSAVSRILSASAALALSGFGELRRDDHSSKPVITNGFQRPTRRLRTGRPGTPPYLALLRAGFCLPLVLPRARCALTAPFHPYSPSRPPGATAQQARDHRDGACHAGASEGREGGRYVFCATFLQVTLTGRYPAHCPAEFGLSSRRSTPKGAKAGDRLAGCGGVIRLPPV